MIKLIPFLLAFSLTYGKNADYLLPDHNSMMTHTLEKILKDSRKEILIITPELNHTPFKRAILEGVKRGSRLVLIVQSLKGDPLALAQYERIEVRTLEGRLLEGSVLLIDNRFECTLPASIDQESFSAHTALIRCSDDETALSSLRTLLTPIIKRSSPYLK